MKKAFSVLLALALLLSLVACSGSSAVGTWMFDGVEKDGTAYTKDELESLGDDSLSDMKIVLSSDGTAEVFDDEDTSITVDWSQSGSTLTIGVAECTLENGRLCVHVSDDAAIYLKKG